MNQVKIQNVLSVVIKGYTNWEYSTHIKLINRDRYFTIHFLI